MSDTVIPLLSRRRERALVAQQAPNLVAAVALLGDGGRRLIQPIGPYDFALAVGEIVVCLLVVVAFVMAAAKVSRAPATGDTSGGVDWLDFFLAAMFVLQAVIKHQETQHWPRPTLVIAVVLVATGAFQRQIVQISRRRRGLQFSNKGLRVGAFLRRFSAEWPALKPIAIGDRWAVLETTSGVQHRIDLTDLGNEQQVRDALREAEILRTAKRRFVEKAPPASNPDNTLYIRPVAPKPAPIPAPVAVPAPVPPPSPPPRAPAPAPAPAPARRGPRPPTILDRPTVIQAAGNKPKKIEEYAGRVNSGHDAVSVARMISPEGWVEPGQQPEFEEITLVLRGMLHVEYRGGALDVRAGQAVVAHPGEWIRYSSPEPGGAEYVAICLPAFSPATVHRDDA